LARERLRSSASEYACRAASLARLAYGAPSAETDVFDRIVAACDTESAANMLPTVQAQIAKLRDLDMDNE
jgi:hypothetical protein